MAEQNYMTALEDLSEVQIAVARAQSALATELLRVIETELLYSDDVFNGRRVQFDDSTKWMRTRALNALRSKLEELKVEVKG